MTSLPEPLPQILPVQAKQASSSSSSRGGDAEAAARSKEAPSRFSDRLRQQDTRTETGAAREHHRSDTEKPAKPVEAPTAPAPDATEAGTAADVSDLAVPPALIVPVLILSDVALPDLGDLNLPGVGETPTTPTGGPTVDPLLAALTKLLDPPPNPALGMAVADLSIETIDIPQIALNAVPTPTVATAMGGGDPEAGLSLTLPLLGAPIATAPALDGDQTTTATSTAAGVAAIPTSMQQAQTGTDTGAGEAPLPEAALPAPGDGERGATTFTAVLATADDPAMTTTATATATTQVDAAPKASSEQRPPAPVANPMERAVAQQVSRALLREGADGLRLTLRLTPPELGTVRIEIVERAGILQAHIHAEDDAVRVALERQLPQLRQDLRSHDAPVRDVHLGDAWSGEFTRQDRNQANGRGSGNRQRGSSFHLDGIAPLARSATAAPTLGGTIAADAVDARA